MARVKKSRISVLNWMGTFLLLAIPGVNIVTLLLTLFCAKSPSKKTFAGAILLWSLILILASVALLMAFPEQTLLLADYLKQIASEM